jgi:hypothetical protein
MKNRNGSKPRRTEQIIAALLQNPTIEKAALALGLSDVTLWRYLNDAEFQEEYRRARREALSQSVARLQSASSTAANTLLRVMLDRDSPVPSKVRAAESILRMGFEAMEWEDLDVRIRKLEESAERR